MAITQEEIEKLAREICRQHEPNTPICRTLCWLCLKQAKKELEAG